MLGAIFLATLHMALTFISCLNNRITFTLAVNIKPTKIQLYLIPTWTRQKQRSAEENRKNLLWQHVIGNILVSVPKNTLKSAEGYFHGVYWVWSCKSSIQCLLYSIFMVKSEVYFWVRFFGTPYKKF